MQYCNATVENGSSLISPPCYFREHFERNMPANCWALIAKACAMDATTPLHRLNKLRHKKQPAENIYQVVLQKCSPKPFQFGRHQCNTTAWNESTFQQAALTKHIILAIKLIAQRLRTATEKISHD